MNARYLNFINGEFTAGFDEKWLSLRGNEIADSSLMDVVRSVQAANKALNAFAKANPNPNSEDRFAVLAKFADLVESHASNFAHAIHEDLGTAPEASLQFSIPETVRALRARYPVAQPLGLIGVITPASDPLTCLASRFAPAFAQGNAVIAKVSRYTPATGSLFARLANEAGVAPGYLAILQGRGEDVGESLVRHPGISTLSFMGSTATGRAVALVAAESFKRVHYSLGAKNPVIVFANPDLETVLAQVAQVCLGAHPAQAYKGSRLFIQESVFKPALEILKVQFAKATVVNPVKPKEAEELARAIQTAEKENGKSLNSNGAALFADLTNCSTLQQEEIAGTLVLAGSFKYAHEALKYANVSPYGRLGYVFDPDVEKARKVAQKLEVGSVFINAAAPTFDPLEEIPLLKGSGFQSEGGQALAKFFARETLVH